MIISVLDKWGYSRSLTSFRMVKNAIEVGKHTYVFRLGFKTIRIGHAYIRVAESVLARPCRVLPEFLVFNKTVAAS